jgi:NarL family two-component system response regulator LiaR
MRAHTRVVRGVRTGVEFDRPLRVRLVSECELVHAGLTQMLSEYDDRVTVLLPGAGRDEIADVALVDPFARRSDDEPDGPAMVTRPPGTARVAVFTWECRDGFIERAMLGGADGYLSKELPAVELVAALEKVCTGERIVALGLASQSDRQAPRALGLTPRETHVVALIAAGAPNKQIARELELSMNTVKSHIRTAYRAMGVTSRTQAVLWAVEHGLTAPWVAVRDEVAS